MKYVFQILIVVLVLSCGTKTDKEKQLPSDYREHHIDFLNGMVILPANFERIGAEELKKELTNIISEPELKSYVSNGFDKLMTAPFGYAVFVDRNNIANYIWIRMGEYVPLDKQIANQYLGMVSANVQMEWGNMGMAYERLENKFLQTGKSDIIKIKYRTQYEEATGFHTQFLMSNNFKTFDFLVVNVENIDLENWIKRTVIK